MIDVEKFVAHVDAPAPEGHGFTLGQDVTSLIDIRPSWHYHEHLHRPDGPPALHSHDADEFGQPTPPDPDPRII